MTPARFFLVVIYCLLYPGIVLKSQHANVSGKWEILDSGFVFNDAPFESCHASTIAELPGQKLMIAWFGGKYEGSPDVSIWVSINEKGKWSKPREVASGVQNDSLRFACWNPVLYKTRNGLLFLHYKVGTSPRTWWAEMKVSLDNGLTWSAAKKLPENFLGPIKNKPVQLRNGDILYPSSTENANNKWLIHIERSDSTGNNWRRINIDCGTFNVIQPGLLVYDNNRMQLLCRSRQNVIVESWSFDGGNTWKRLQATSLPNPNSGIDAVTVDSRVQLLVYNPSLSGKDWWQGRSILKVSVSANGHQWKDICTLENHEEGEYSYPAVIRGTDGTVYISYTVLRKKIKYVRLKFKSL